MFKIDNYFKSSDIFNEVLIKRFEEKFKPQNGSRLWVTPGHLVFTTDNNKVHTCDARPYDFSTSPSEGETDELVTTISSVLEILFDTLSEATRMFIVLTNGDVQIFEYRILLYEWARIGYFNVNIVSPSSNNNHMVLTHVLISYYQNMIYWAQKPSHAERQYELYRREIPLNGVREITQSALGARQTLFQHWPQFELVEIRDNICLIPNLPCIDLYCIVSPRSHIGIFHIDAKCLWRCMIKEKAIDFRYLFIKVMFTTRRNQKGIVTACKLLDTAKEYAYVFHNKTLLSIASNGEIHKRRDFNITACNVKDCYIILNLLYVFYTDDTNFEVHNMTNGQLVQQFDFTEFSPISGVWCHSSSISTIGFYIDNRILKVNYKPFNSLLVSEPPCLLQSLNMVKDERLHVFTLLRDAMYHKFEYCDIPPFKAMPKILQSEALLLAVFQLCRENGFKFEDFPVRKIKDFFAENKIKLPETKLKELLQPIVECFEKLENYKNSELKSANEKGSLK